VGIRIGRVTIPTIGRRAASANLYQGGPTIVPMLTPSVERQEYATTAEAVRKNPLIFAPVWKIALRMGALPIKVFSIDGETGARNEAPNHPAYNLLRAPNPAMTRSTFISGTVASLFIHTRAAWLKQRQNGQLVELWPIPVQYLTAERDPRGLIREFVVNKNTSDEKRLSVNDVCYFRLLPGFEDWAEGTSPLQALEKVAQFGQSALEAMTDLFDHGILGRVWVDLNGKVIEEGDDALDRLNAQMAAVRRDRFAAPVMEDGAEIKNMGDAASDEVMHRALDSATKIIYEAFGLPQDGDDKAFYSAAVQPIADVMEQEMERTLMTEWPDDPAFPEFGFREILKGSPLDRIEMHARAILTMQETPAEAREDENRPFMDGSDRLFGPLNIIDLMQLIATQQRPPADTQGGLGGVEGKGTFPPSVMRPLPETGGRQLAARARAVTDRWSLIRDREISRQAEAFSRQARGVLKREQAQMRRLFTPTRASSTSTGIPPLPDLIEVIREHDALVATQLSRFMSNAGSNAWTAAEDFVAAQAQDMNLALHAAYRDRAEVVAQRFGLARETELVGLFEKAHELEWTTRELDTQIAQQWSGLATHYVDGVGRTEMAWAHERAAMSAWRSSGIEELDFVFGGGPCSTGVCLTASENSPMRIGTSTGDVGSSFAEADSPPLHPNCTCFMVPHVATAVGMETTEDPLDSLRAASTTPEALDVEGAATKFAQANPGFERYVGDMDQTIGAFSTTDETFRVGTVWNDARRTEQDRIVDEYWSRAGGDDIAAEGRAVISGGMPGAGKSTAFGTEELRAQGIVEDDFLTLNSDTVKALMVETGMADFEGLNGLEAAALIHDESSAILDRLVSRALAQQKNVILDITLKSEATGADYLNALRAAGYDDTTMMFVHVPPNVSVERALKRFWEKVVAHSPEARYVPPGYIAKMVDEEFGSVNLRNFVNLRDRADRWILFDNSGAEMRFVEGG
jgi:HK97 family phage portal protein